MLKKIIFWKIYLSHMSMKRSIFKNLGAILIYLILIHR